ncbi:hypothetical protein ZIOFF_051057 [Zingiber officinale]|uniref:Uncharacterized protein n=1 Tax=Zingiber officinale TaxID=94328 RepID=A0A8J5FL86_ZINOF|nr:hypothetical protein ZIOFF_051057 [Zingiber officinale]
MEPNVRMCAYEGKKLRRCNYVSTIVDYCHAEIVTLEDQQLVMYSSLVLERSHGATRGNQMKLSIEQQQWQLKRAHG